MSSSNPERTSMPSTLQKIMGRPPASPVALQSRENYVEPNVLRAELILGPTGPFRPIIECYLSEEAPNRYVERDLVVVRGDIASFFRFVVNELHIEDLDQIRPSTITRYVEKRRSEGYSSFLFLGKLATFFVWAISEGLYDNGNPVVKGVHRKLALAPRATSSIEN